MAGGRLDTRLPAGPADEFGAWATAFNEMADALEAKIAELVAAQARERRFTANVAHELRTPLAALVAEASVLSEQGGQLPEQARRPVELLIADVRRLRTLVDELMEISRLDAGSEPVRRQVVDVRSIVSALLSARGWQDKVAVIGGPLTLTTDPRRIERILDNLIGNAIEHGGSRHRGPDRRKRRPRLDRGRRRRSRHIGRAPAARLRALLQGRLRAGQRGQRPRPGHRTGASQAARRHDQRGERCGPRVGVPADPAAGAREAL